MTLSNTALPVREVDGPNSGPPVVLAIDLGTGGPKAAVVGTNGRIVAHAFESVPFEVLSAGAAEQDPRRWWAAVVSTARQALAESGVTPEQVVGVGCTAQWSGTVAVDAGGEPIGNAISWMDSRGSREVRRTVRGPVNAMGYDVRHLAAWIRKTGGIPSQSGRDPVGHILFLRHSRPEVYQQTAVFLEPVDFLNLRLTGVARASFDTITLHWVTDNRQIDAVAYDPTLLSMANLERSKLPDLVPTATVIGGLHPDTARELGLLPGTAVTTGTGDLHSAAVGSGAVADLDAHLYIGTSSWISCHVPYKKVAPLTNITSIPSGIPGRYLVADEHETGGACLTWLRDNLLFPADGLSPQAAGAAGAAGVDAPTDFFARMNDLVASVPAGSNGVLFSPWLNGERSPVDDHTIRAGFHNLSMSSTRSDMVRAVFEGVAYNSKWLLGAVEKYTGKPFPTLTFVGGGANSDLWSQMHADVTGRIVRQVADPVLANVRGAGLLTLLALGRVKVSEIPAMVEIKAEYRPDLEAAKVYELPATEFVNFYKQTKSIHRRLNRHVSGE